MAYNSFIDIKLGAVPKATDSQIFADLMDIYNAIHILAQYVDVAATDTNPRDNGNTAKQMAFKQAFWAKAAQATEPGDLVTVGSGGWYKGVTWGLVPYYGTRTRAQLDDAAVAPNSGTIGIYGVILDGGAAGDRVRIGLPPVILNVTGASYNQTFVGSTARGTRIRYKPEGPLVTNGTFYTADGGIYAYPSSYYPEPYDTFRNQVGYLRIGIGVETDAVFLYAPSVPQTTLDSVTRSVSW